MNSSRNPLATFLDPNQSWKDDGRSQIERENSKEDIFYPFCPLKIENSPLFLLRRQNILANWEKLRKRYFEKYLDLIKIPSKIDLVDLYNNLRILRRMNDKLHEYLTWTRENIEYNIRISSLRINE